MNNMNFNGMNPMGMNNNGIPGMNNMGIINMNNMGMMGINNMGMAGMNNQMNLMNMNAPNIQNIIQSYENRINELEELIKQKDLEIISLNQKLNNNNNPNNLMPNINHNQKLCPANDFISINIKGIIECSKKDETSVIQDILKNGNLSNNHIPISSKKTIEENGIKDGSTINICNSIYNLRFSVNPSKGWTIVLDGDCSIKQAIKYFHEQVKSEIYFQKISNEQMYFVYNNTKLNIQDETPIKNFFTTSLNPKILIFNYADGAMGG